MTLLPILDVEHASQYQRTTLIQPRKGSGLPSGYGLREIKLLGKGSNNAVYLYKTKHGQEVVVRKPRRKSDTQRVGNATWEFRNTAIAVAIGVAPVMYDAWYTRHTTTDQKGGLHIICDYYPKDMHTLLMESPEVISENTDEIASIVSKALRRMAENGLFCYDLKPSNMVVREDPKMDIKFIDFGRDFCEWRPYSDQNEHLDRAPILSFVQSLADDNANTRYPAKELYVDLIYITMLVLLSSNIAYTLDQSSTASRHSFAENAILNFMASTLKSLRAQVDVKQVRLIKEILRQRDIRDTLRHYMGRRNCGTKRCFYYAAFTL
jgi:tRNA A-37 threonylcarbamoyl transferase component Bud32